MNLYEVTPAPKKDEDNASVVNVAVRLQIKLFYRPDNLKANISEISNQLQFIQNKGSHQLIIKNPTPFYVTFNRLQMSKTGEPLPAIFLKPFSEQFIEIKQNNTSDNKIQYSLIDDSGDQNDYEKTIEIH